MEATITLKLTPREFDLLRTAMEIRANQQAERAEDRTVEPASRRKSREEAAELGLLLERVR